MGKITPPFLKKGDKIRIVSPAGRIDPEPVQYAKNWLKRQGFNVEIGPNALNRHFQFAGTDEERAEDLQNALDDPEIRLILCSRGGYGCVRTLQLINWDKFYQSPKWICGYSDATAIHSVLGNNNVSSIHGTMPVNVRSNSDQALRSFINAITGAPNEYLVQQEEKLNFEVVKGEIVGGNLSMIYSMMGTPFQLDTRNKILFIEEIDEYMYHIDRMLMSLKHGGLFDRVKALIVGSFTNIKDNKNPFGGTLIDMLNGILGDEVVLLHGFPAGHIEDNRAIMFGRLCQISCMPEGYKFEQ